MKATEQLMKEHEAVLRMLDVLNSVKDKLSSGVEVSADDMESMVEFLRIFVDKCHHGKEETLLFPKLVEIGIPNEGGPVGVMLDEHVQGREYIRGFAEGIGLYRKSRQEGKSMITDNISGYSALLENHIYKENNILFRMADMHLETTEQDELYRKFDELEENVIGHAKHEEFHRLLDDLSRKYR